MVATASKYGCGRKHQLLAVASVLCYSGVVRLVSLDARGTASSSGGSRGRFLWGVAFVALTQLTITPVVTRNRSYN